MPFLTPSAYRDPLRPVRGGAVALMHIRRRVRSILRALLQAYGTKNAKRYFWNRQFSRGHWDFLESTPADCVYRHLESYAKNGNILDLGCGSGSTANELAATAYHSYTGVDISDAAIEKARRRTEENGRAQKNRYFQSDILTYVPTQLFTVILLRESIYYIPCRKITAVLDRYSHYLEEGGVFMIRMWNATGKYMAIVDTIERHFPVLEKHSYTGATIVLIFQPPSTGPSKLKSPRFPLTIPRLFDIPFSRFTRQAAGRPVDLSSQDPPTGRGDNVPRLFNSTAMLFTSDSWHNAGVLPAAQYFSPPKARPAASWLGRPE